MSDKWVNGNSSDIDEMDEMLELHNAYQNKINRLDNSNMHQQKRETLGEILTIEMDEIMSRRK